MGVDGLLFNAPATRARVDGLLARLQVPAGGRVVDVGCGRGEMLAMLAEAVGAIGTGIDPDDAEIALARDRRPSRGRLLWHCAKVADVTVEPNCDAAICVGATHAYGPPGEALPRTIKALSGYVRAGGRVLVGEGYWKQEPLAAYLQATQFAASDLQSHDANAAAGNGAGLTLLHAETSSIEEWDHFEGAFLRAAERRHAESPHDTAAIANLKHWRAWHDAYRKWGRETLGFGYYVFEK